VVGSGREFGSGRVVGARGSEEKERPEASPARGGAWSVFWLRDFWWSFVLTRRSRVCLSKDKRSSLEAAAEIRTCGFAGDR
jgi:hypothetical protein